MKKWIIPVLAVTLVGMTFSAPAHAWPWGKKEAAEAEQAEQKPEKKQGLFRRSNEESQSQQEAQAAPNAPATKSASVDTPAPAAPVEQAAPRVQVKSPLSDELNGLKVEEPVESNVLPPEKSFVAVDDPKNPLGITTSAKKLNDSAGLISQRKYKEAEKMLAPLKDWLVDATETHINLHKTLKEIPSAQVQAELEKQLALQFALLRDKAFFQLGMLGVGMEDYSMAIKNLSKVIQSQPRSPMGAQAYEVLQKIGFTEKMQLREEKRDENKS
jgi:hypothetical protein